VEWLAPNTAESDAEEGSSLSVAGFLRFLSRQNFVFNIQIIDYMFFNFSSASRRDG
jgi:hypothetical protein